MIGHVAWLHKGIKDNEEATGKYIDRKEKIIEGISSQLCIVITEANIQIDTLKGIFRDVKENDETTKQRLEDELKKRPKFLNVPPLKTVVGMEAQLHRELKKKEELIEVLKDGFERNYKELYTKYKDEIA